MNKAIASFHLSVPFIFNQHFMLKTCYFEVFTICLYVSSLQFTIGSLENETSVKSHVV